MKREERGFAESAGTQRGFTLVELIAVAAVIAVLPVMFAAALNSMSEADLKAVCSSNMKQLGAGVSMYAGMYDGYIPPSAYQHETGNICCGEYYNVRGYQRRNDNWFWARLLRDMVDSTKIFHCKAVTNLAAGNAAPSPERGDISYAFSGPLSWTYETGGAITPHMRPFGPKRLAQVQQPSNTIAIAEMNIRTIRQNLRPYRNGRQYMALSSVHDGGTGGTILMVDGSVQYQLNADLESPASSVLWFPDKSAPPVHN